MHSTDRALELSFTSTAMTKRSLLMAALLAAGSAGVAGAAPVGAGGGDERAVRELIEALEAANNGGDAERWASFFAEEFVYMVPGMPAVTRRAELLEVARAGFRNQATIGIDVLEVRVWRADHCRCEGAPGPRPRGRRLVADRAAHEQQQQVTPERLEIAP